MSNTEFGALSESEIQAWRPQRSAILSREIFTILPGFFSHSVFARGQTLITPGELAEEELEDMFANIPEQKNITVTGITIWRICQRINYILGAEKKFIADRSYAIHKKFLCGGEEKLGKDVSLPIRGVFQFYKENANRLTSCSRPHKKGKELWEAISEA